VPRFACPGCRTQYQVEDTHAGKSFDCPFCGQSLAVPAAPPPAEPAPGPAVQVWAPDAAPPPVRSAQPEPPPVPPQPTGPTPQVWAPGVAPPVRAAPRRPAPGPEPADEDDEPADRGSYVGRPPARPRTPWLSTLLLFAAVVLFTLPWVEVRYTTAGDPAPRLLASQSGTQMVSGQYTFTPPPAPKGAKAGAAPADPGSVAPAPWVGLYPMLLILAMMCGMALQSGVARVAAVGVLTCLAAAPVVAQVVAGLPLEPLVDRLEVAGDEGLQFRGGVTRWAYLSVGLTALAVIAAARSAWPRR
jgi:hypothetical protein